MALPRSNMRINRNGVQFVSNIDRVQYSLQELSRAALRDVARFLKYQIRQEFNKLKGLRKQNKRFKSAYQHWLRKRDCDLQIGIKHNTWYGVDQELGTKNQPKRDILRNAVFNNIDKIIEIESQYLEIMNDESRIESVINEDEEID